MAKLAGKEIVVDEEAVKEAVNHLATIEIDEFIAGEIQNLKDHRNVPVVAVVDFLANVAVGIIEPKLPSGALSAVSEEKPKIARRAVPITAGVLHRLRSVSVRLGVPADVLIQDAWFDMAKYIRKFRCGDIDRHVSASAALSRF